MAKSRTVTPAELGRTPAEIKRISEEVLAEVRQRPDACKAMFMEMKIFLAGRKPGSLRGADAVTFMAMEARFTDASFAQKRVAEAMFAERLAR